MPKLTYFNLDPIKQRTILEACIQEFSRVPFSQASINKIIQSASISRGSFYQYFEDKEDCYMHVLSHIAQIKMKIFEQTASLSSDASFFDHLNTMVKQTMVWIEKEPEFYMIGYWMDYDDSDFMLKLTNANQSGMRFLHDLINKDKDRGLIKKDIDPDLFIRMMNALTKDIILEAYRKRNFESVNEHFVKITDILRKGVEHVSSQ